MSFLLSDVLIVLQRGQDITQLLRVQAFSSRETTTLFLREQGLLLSGDNNSGRGGAGSDSLVPSRRLVEHQAHRGHQAC